MNKKAKITLIEKVTEKVIKIRFALVEPNFIEFKPGQFVSLKVDTMIRRSYSIGSSTIHNEYIDLYNDVEPGGPGSKYFLKAKVGDEAEFLGPLGIFFYKKSERPIIFIATGTGIAALYPMISHALENERTKRKLILYFGLRHEEDLFLEDELKDLKERFENFDYKIALSRAGDKWEGEKGYVTELIDRDFKGVNGMEAYICGGQAMISSAEELLLKKGMDSESIFYEKFY